jgi:hypothetical protein
MGGLLNWRMNASMHVSAVRALEHDLRECAAKLTPFSIRTIVDLLPLSTPNRKEVIARGACTIDASGKWINKAGSDLRVQFDDPAMGTFYVTIPREWTGTISASPDLLRIVFDPALHLEIPKLATMGVGRGSFQDLLSLSLSKQEALSSLVDVSDASMRTDVHALLEEAVSSSVVAGSALTLMDFFSLSQNCGGTSNPDDPNWYVVRRNDGLCFVHYGTFIDQAEVYTIIWGPGKLADANAAQSKLCDFNL